MAEQLEKASADTQANKTLQPGANATDNAMARAQAQSHEAVKGMKQDLQTAVAAEKLGAKTMATETPEKPPNWQDKPSQTQTEQATKQGEKMQSHGVTTKETQSAETKAQLQAALDKSASKGQTAQTQNQSASRCDAARQQAASAPPSPTPQPGMSK